MSYVCGEGMLWEERVAGDKHTRTEQCILHDKSISR